jgi:hypothetical protein
MTVLRIGRPRALKKLATRHLHLPRRWAYCHAGASLNRDPRQRPRHGVRSNPKHRTFECRRVQVVSCVESDVPYLI